MDFSFENLDFSFDQEDDKTDLKATKENLKQIEKDEKKGRVHRRTVDQVALSLKYEYRRAYSETKLLDFNIDFKKDHSYNFITGGDIDALSYLKLMLRHTKTLDYVLFSTWCMAYEDILQIKEWLEKGVLKRVDAYLGEIFPGSYKLEWKLINKVWKDHDCGRIAVFKNHSKIFSGYKGDFYFGIQTSANINTNPRTENGCITINQGIFNFYKDYFDGIKTIVREKNDEQ